MNYTYPHQELSPLAEGGAYALPNLEDYNSNPSTYDQPFTSSLNMRDDYTSHQGLPMMKEDSCYQSGLYNSHNIPPPLIPINDYKYNTDSSSSSYQSEPLCLVKDRDEMFPPPEEEQGRKKQHCRMCYNHNEMVLMKGHKHLCRHKNCNCSACLVTRESQDAMKKQQQITREQKKKPKPTMMEEHLPINLNYPEYRKMEMSEVLASTDSEFKEDEYAKLMQKITLQKKKTKKNK